MRFDIKGEDFFGKRGMTWDEFEAEVQKLAAKIDFTPDIIVGIARGGVIPATLFSYIFRVKDMFVLKLEKKGEKQISAFALKDVAGKRVLLVEDMIETGRGMMGGKEFLQGKGAEVKTACLYTMAKSEIVPDFSLKRLHEAPEFPWNKKR